MPQAKDETLPLLPKSIPAPMNPFVNGAPMTKYEWTKCILMCAFGIPVLRLALVLVLVLVLVILACLVTLGHGPEMLERGIPLSSARRILYYPMRIVIRAIYFVLGFYWISISTPPPNNNNGRRTSPRIIVSNHITFLDGPFLASLNFPSVALRADMAKVRDSFLLRYSHYIHIIFTGPARGQRHSSLRPDSH